jgi:multicomponent Na+:H+ antiporter subunit F
MNAFLLAAAAGVLATVALGLVRVVRGPACTDRVMAAQLLGTGGLGALLLYGVATRTSAALDVALLLAVLTPFATVALYRGVVSGDDDDPPGGAGA